MIQQLEKQIRDLQKELAEVQKGQAALRLQPCEEIQKYGRRMENWKNWLGEQRL